MLVANWIQETLYAALFLQRVLKIPALWEATRYF